MDGLFLSLYVPQCCPAAVWHGDMEAVRLLARRASGLFVKQTFRCHLPIYGVKKDKDHSLFVILDMQNYLYKGKNMG